MLNTGTVPGQVQCVHTRINFCSAPAVCRKSHKYVPGANGAFTCEECPAGSEAGDDIQDCACLTSEPYAGGDPDSAEGCREWLEGRFGLSDGGLASLLKPPLQGAMMSPSRTAALLEPAQLQIHGRLQCQR